MGIILFVAVQKATIVLTSVTRHVATTTHGCDDDDDQMFAQWNNANSKYHSLLWLAACY